MSTEEPDEMGPADSIAVESMVNGRTLEPLVVLKWGANEGNLGLREAREHALSVLEAAESARTDAFLFGFFRFAAAQVGDGDEAAAAMLREFRAYRHRQLSLDERIEQEAMGNNPLAPDEDTP